MIHVKGLDRSTKQIVFAYGTALVLFVIGMVISSSFAGSRNTIALSTEAAFIGIAAIGQTLAMLSGGVDLSMPWTMTGAAILLSQTAGGDDGALWWAIPLALLFGAVVGAVNGIGIAILEVSPIVMTLAMNVLLQGLILVATAGQPGSTVPPALASFCAARWGPVRVIFLLWIALAVATTLLLTKTTFGRRLYAVGTNERVARLSGVRTSSVRIVSWILTGVAGALAGILVAGFNQLVYLGLGDPYLFATIAAVAIGGIAMTGGAGSYIGTFAGALVLATLSAGLLVLNISTAFLLIAFGAAILLTVSLGSRGVDPVQSA